MVVVVVLLAADPPVSVDVEVLVFAALEEVVSVPPGATTVVLFTFLSEAAPGAAVVSVFCSQAAKSAIAGRSQRYFFMGF